MSSRQQGHRLRLCIFCLLFSLVLSGCATVGPRIDPEELKQAHEYYEVKARRHRYSQLVRVHTIAERLLATLPEERRPKKPKPWVGILLDHLTKISGRAFGIPGISESTQIRRKPESAPLIVGVLADSPAARAGIQPGDLLLKVGKRKTSTPRKAIRALKAFEPGTQVTFLLEREGVPFERELILGEKSYPVAFNIQDREQVNASASPGRITVTSGLLRFVSSDDELAMVMAHELAHLTEGHYVKKLGPEVVAGAIGIIERVAIPGIGKVFSRIITAGIRAPFSQGFEREADTLGLQYVYRAGYKLEAGIQFWDRFATELPASLSRSFFNTHPTSPERLLRLKKTIQELSKNEPAP